MILVTGATGYVGGRLVPRLLASGYQVRALVRDTARLQGRPWVKQTEVVQGDVLKPETLGPAVAGVSAAFYLIHSLHNKDHRYTRDLRAAHNFGQACKSAGVERIIYLGELGDSEGTHSEHLRSRLRTGDALRESGVSVTEVRTSLIVGSGSLAFEMIRYLTELVPVMICPRWVNTRVQPIAIQDLLLYLTAVLERPNKEGLIIEVGGADILKYRDMLMQYAEERKMRRFLIQVPVITPRLSSYWIHWMTPVPAATARALVEGFRNEAVVGAPSAQQLFPEINPVGYRQAVRQALAYLEASNVETTWRDALVTSLGDVTPIILKMHDGMLIEQRKRLVAAPASITYQAFSRLGGDQGWLTFNWAWQFRGVLDRFMGGVGFRRGRRDPIHLRVGDALDFWRVEAIEKGRLLRLRAEMKLPGRAWLQFEATPTLENRTILTQTAFFASRGLLGLLYWYALYPIHRLIFSSTIRKLAEQAETLSAESELLAR